MSASVAVRMYNQLNPGECFLLRFADGKHESFVLIDFGSYEKGNELRELEIAENIFKTVGDKPLIVILTQEDREHLSGFISGAPFMKKINISEVWSLYAGDTTGKDANSIRKITETLRTRNRGLKEKARAKFGEINAVAKMLNAQDNIDVLTEDQVSSAAIKNLVTWSKQKPKYLSCGESFELPGIENKLVRIYVLGPGSNNENSIETDSSNGHSETVQPTMAKIRNLDASSSLMFDALSADEGLDQAESKDFPFNKKFIQPVYNSSGTSSVSELYYQTDEWRRIDHVWLNEIGRISLQMNSLTGRSSRVLAFELVDQQKVLLFSTDADIDNWQSRADNKPGNTDVKGNNNVELKVTDLLSRVVLYKPGRHKHENSTPGKSNVMVNQDELVIMIPMNEVVSNRINFAIIDREMLEVYNRMSQGRIIRSDTLYHTERSEHSYKFPFASTEYDFPSTVNKAYDRVNESHLYVEYIIH